MTRTPIKRARYTTEQRDNLLRTYDRRPDMTARQIADKHKVNYGTTLKWIGHLLDYRMKNKPTPPDDDTDIQN